jgi:hypothetical protein
LRDDSEDRELAALRQEASAYNGLSCEATLGFAANGVMHYWTTVTAWYAQYIDRLNGLQPSENPLIQRMPAAQERDMVARLTKELVQSPEFRSAANAAQRRRVARTQSEIATLRGDPRYEYQQVAFIAIQRANEAVSAEVDATYRALEVGLDSLATEFANTTIFKSTVSARARREHARDFLVEKAGGYPVPGRLLELFLDTAPLQRSKPRSTDRYLVLSLACFGGWGLVPGVLLLPPACFAACPGFLFGDEGSDGLGPSGCWPVPGWSGRCGGWAAGGVQEVQPFVLAVPAFGQVQGNVAAAVPGGAGRDGDQVPADGRGPGLRERQAGQGGGGAQQVMGDGRDGQPGRVRGEHPDGM